MVETGNPKGPCKPEGIRRVLEVLHVAPEDAMYIGDALLAKKPDAVCFAPAEVLEHLQLAQGQEVITIVLCYDYKLTAATNWLRQ